MSSYNDGVIVLTASSNAIFSSQAIRVSKVVLHNTANGSNIISALLYDGVTASGTIKIGLTTNPVAAASATFEQYRSETFDPPVVFQQFLSVTLAGSNVTCRIYYDRP